MAIVGRAIEPGLCDPGSVHGPGDVARTSVAAHRSTARARPESAVPSTLVVLSERRRRRSSASRQDTRHRERADQLSKSTCGHLGTSVNSLILVRDRQLASPQGAAGPERGVATPNLMTSAAPPFPGATPTTSAVTKSATHVRGNQGLIAIPSFEWPGLYHGAPSSVGGGHVMRWRATRRPARRPSGRSGRFRRGARSAARPRSAACSIGTGNICGRRTRRQPPSPFLVRPFRSFWTARRRPAVHGDVHR